VVEGVVVVESEFVEVRRRRGLSWEQMAELAVRDGQPEAAAEFRRRARAERRDVLPGVTEYAVPAPKDRT
jgi:hypothetical protein